MVFNLSSGTSHFESKMTQEIVPNKGCNSRSPKRQKYACASASSTSINDAIKELLARCATIEGIVVKAKRNAERADIRQANKTKDALQIVSMAQNKEKALDSKAINAIRKRVYTEAIGEQIKAEHAKSLADDVELLAFNLLRAAKKAEQDRGRADITR